MAVRRATTRAAPAARKPATCRKSPAATGMTSTKATAAACGRASSMDMRSAKAGPGLQESAPRASTTCSGLRSGTTCRKPNHKHKQKGSPNVGCPSALGCENKLPGLGLAGGEKCNSVECGPGGEDVAEAFRIGAGVLDRYAQETERGGGRGLGRHAEDPWDVGGGERLVIA